MTFIGRETELKALAHLKKKETSSLSVIKGRRRIGKSRLVEEFAKKYTYYSFSGFPPSKKDTADNQRKFFALQLERYFHVPLRYDNWYELFVFLYEQTKSQNAVILLDEISWMGSKDPAFLGTLKTVWDHHFKQNPNLLLVIWGSVSSWIDKNILSHTGFVGRISLTLTLKELSLKESALFWKKSGKNISPYEKLKLLSITGGIPRYLEEIDPHQTAEENIQRLCFTPSGILYQDFDQIFSDLFMSRTETYKKTVESLIEGSLERKDIANKIQLPSNGRLTEYLDDLIKSGFIQKDGLWNLRKQIAPKLNLYRLSDNYLRFYLKYIDPDKNKIEKTFYEKIHLSSFPGWSTIMGLQTENLILNNRFLILQEIGIPPEIILNDGPYLQHKKGRNLGCQIDYLIQTRLNELYFIEIKFHKDPLGSEIITDVQEKIKRFIRPKNFSIRPILIHVNGIKPNVEDSKFFTKIIDLSETVS